MKYLITESVSSFESNQQVFAVTKENTHITKTFLTGSNFPGNTKLRS
jgi:hypothetical protein